VRHNASVGGKGKGMGGGTLNFLGETRRAHELFEGSSG